MKMLLGMSHYYPPFRNEGNWYMEKNMAQVTYENRLWDSKDPVSLLSCWATCVQPRVHVTHMPWVSGTCSLISGEGSWEFKNKTIEWLGSLADAHEIQDSFEGFWEHFPPCLSYPIGSHSVQAALLVMTESPICVPFLTCSGNLCSSLERYLETKTWHRCWILKLQWQLSTNVWKRRFIRKCQLQ